MEYDVRALLENVKAGTTSIEEATKTLRTLPFEDLGYAKVDHHRAVRQGAPEVIYGAGKTPEQVRGIVSAMLARGAKNILVTRSNDAQVEAVQDLHENIQWHPIPRVLIINRVLEEPTGGTVLVCAAGTSDMSVCEEAALTAELMGARVKRLYDVGVAGIHRLLSHVDEIMSANVLIAVAGMEGALPSVLAGLVDRPVIAVPTSVGYGANFGGLSALLTMINSCASGISVVNIDNGFGAGYLAAMINRPARV